MKPLLTSICLPAISLCLLLSTSAISQEDHPETLNEKPEESVVPAIQAKGEAGAVQRLSLKTKTCEAVFENGSLSLLRKGEVECVKGVNLAPAAFSFNGAWHEADRYLLTGDVLTGGFTKEPLKEASIKIRCHADERTGDIIVQEEAAMPAGGLEAVRWSIGKVPIDWTVIVPNGGGMKFSKDSPAPGLNADGPMFWELPLLILQSPQGGGFYVMSEDREWPFYSLRVNKSKKGFDISLVTWNAKPFKDKKACRSMTWIVNSFEGDWRVPAKRMRDFFEKELGSKANFDSNPAWVKDISCVLLDERMDTARIQWLLDKRVVEPRNTMVFLSHWRSDDFDRNYPNYLPNEKALAFIRFLKEKGFRVALYSNWFCCDPRNPFYKQVSAYTVKNPDGSIKKFLDPRRTPPVEEHYINPAAPEWRQEFVRRATEAIRLTGADCLHLDQNFHCHNYDGTQIGDMSMIEGDLAFHRELRQALPDVALAGEGLNGLTARYLAFAQRHVWSLIPQLIDRRDLAKYHPVSTYIFQPTTRIYGWLGVGDPAQRDGQLYAAWREGLAHMGAMPTFRTLFLTDKAQVENPQGFRRTEFDEIAFWQKNRIEPDLEGPWPEDVVFPFKSEDGKIHAARMADGSLRTSDRLISRAVAGESKLSGPGSIGGNFYYDSNAIYGLNPERWYPFFDEPRDLAAFHLEKMPDGLKAVNLKEDEKSICFEILPEGKKLFSMVQSLPKAKRGCLLKGEDGQIQEVIQSKGSDDANFGTVRASAGMLAMRPPARPSGAKINNEMQYAGTGQEFVSYQIAIPAKVQTRFVADVSIHGESLGLGHSDGADFEVTAKSNVDQKTASASLSYDAKGLNINTNQPRQLTLDLSQFAGEEITLRLSMGPGPANNATKDNGLWRDPRVETFFKGEGRLTAVIPFQPAMITASGRQVKTISVEGNRFELETELPGRIEIRK